jgi:hypothetical protein
MGDQARPLAGAPADGVVPPPGMLEVVIRALAGVLTTGGSPPAPSAGPPVDKPLLDLEETAGLLGVSRMTVARMADEGGCHRWSSAGEGCRKYAGSHGHSWIE